LRLRALCGRAYLFYPDHRKQAIEEFEAVLAEDAKDAQIHFLLGTAFRDEGLKARAMGHFRKALELCPHHKEARSELLRFEKDGGG
jgi:tetratricopeptide (TPR) repeat protein